MTKRQKRLLAMMAALAGLLMGCDSPTAPSCPPPDTLKVRAESTYVNPGLPTVTVQVRYLCR